MISAVKYLSAETQTSIHSPRESEFERCESVQEIKSRLFKKKYAIDVSKVTAKTLLKFIVEASDVFPPLKSVAAGLRLIVDRIEVRRYS